MTKCLCACEARQMRVPHGHSLVSVQYQPGMRIASGTFGEEMRDLAEKLPDILLASRPPRTVVKYLLHSSVGRTGQLSKEFQASQQTQGMKPVILSSCCRKRRQWLLSLQQCVPFPRFMRYKPRVAQHNTLKCKT